MADEPIPVACTLTTKQAAERTVEWQDVQRLANAITPIEDGVRFDLDAAHETSIRDLAERERACCAFLAIEVRTHAERLHLDVTTPTAEGQEVIALLAGVSAT